MHSLAVYTNRPRDAEKFCRQLEKVFDSRCNGLRDLASEKPDLYTVIDTNLTDDSYLPDLKAWMAKKPKDGKVIFVVDRGSRIEEARAFALGASDIVHRPVNGRELLAKIWGEFTALAGSKDEFGSDESRGVVAAFDALRKAFSAACLGGSIDTRKIDAAGEHVVSQIGEQGLSGWIETVRKHHSQTYQHCLLVTGVAVAFGQHLGVSHTDRLRLSFAGLLHDVGKARIPISILEKPGPLDQKEAAVMREHPQLGIEALATVPGLPAEVLDIVGHHHEHLDGTGYPHGLQGNEISDLVRIMTIADIYGALIERRSYKPPLPGDAAYQMLLDMGPKLDKDLLRVFRPVSQFGHQR